MLSFLTGNNQTALVVLSLAIMLGAGFLVTRVTKKLKLPNVTGYLFAGILLGPYVLHIIPEEISGSMGFVTDIALAYIAFGVGKYFKLSTLREKGGQTILITLLESLAAMVIVTLSMIFIFHLSVPFALLLGAIGSATAPASTIMTIHQYRAKGPFVELILKVVALDDAVALIAFSVCAAVCQASSGGGSVDAAVVIMPVVFNILALGLGVIMGFLLSKLAGDNRSTEHRLVLANTFLLALVGICTLLDISPLLSCLALGTACVNFSGNKTVFKQINKFSPPVLLLFFVLSGMRLNIPALISTGIIGVAYFLLRIVGKYAGAFAGCAICKTPRATRNCLGMALIPQAGVSIGLAALGERLLPPELGGLLSVIILSSAVLYEIIGPVSAKLSLMFSHTIKKGDKKPAKIRKKAAAQA